MKNGKSNEYKFLSTSVPRGEKSTYNMPASVSKFKGLCMFDFATGGYIRNGRNFEITPNGTLRTARKFTDTSINIGGSPLGLYSHGSDIYAVCNNRGTVKLVRADTSDDFRKKSVNLSGTDEEASTNEERSLALFSVWTGESDIVSGTFEDRIIIFPDRKQADFQAVSGSISNILRSRYEIKEIITTYTVTKEEYYNSGYTFDEATKKAIITGHRDGYSENTISETNEAIHGYSYTSDVPESIPKHLISELASSYSQGTTQGSDGDNINYLIKTTVTIYEKTEYTSRLVTGENCIPEADYITVFGTRLFGVKDNRIFASGSGSYDNYELDTATDISEDNAWYCATDYDKFNHLTVFDGRVTAFTSSGLYQVYGSKNPFRVKEICHTGTASGKSVATSDNLLYFAGKNDIYIFSGSYPKSISENLIDMESLCVKNICGGAYDGKYYFTDNNNGLFIYDRNDGVWTVCDSFSDDGIYGFISTSEGLYAIDNVGSIYSNEGNERYGEWFAELPTEAYGKSRQTADIKELRGIQGLFNFHGSGGGSVTVKIKLDGGEYFTVGSLTKASSGIYPLYCIIPKSDYVTKSIKIECSGDVEVISLEQKYSMGGVKYGA